MPPTAFAEVRGGLDLGRKADEAIDRLLAIKEIACERERAVPEAALLPLVADCFAALERHPWRRPSNDIVSPRADLERIFRAYVCV